MTMPYKSLTLIGLSLLTTSCVSNKDNGEDSFLIPVVSGTVIKANGAPSPRAAHTAHWTGNAMLVYGGMPDDQAGPDEATEFAEAKVYYPATSSWRSLPHSRSLPRYHHSALWTGEQLIVFGGINTHGSRTTNGLIFDWQSKSWERLSDEKAPGARSGHSAVWTGEDMIVFGGEGDDAMLPDGSAYSITSDSWKRIPGVKIAPRAYHAALWTGSDMIVWGGDTEMEET